MNDASDIGAMTWAMIVGEDNVMDVRRLVEGTTAIVNSEGSHCRSPIARYPTSSLAEGPPWSGSDTVTDGTTHEALHTRASEARCSAEARL